MEINGLPDTLEEVRAEIEFYEHIETKCDMLRTGKRPELSPVATRELLRTQEILRKLRMKVERIKKKAA